MTINDGEVKEKESITDFFDRITCARQLAVLLY